MKFVRPVGSGIRAQDEEGWPPSQEGTKRTKPTPALHPFDPFVSFCVNRSSWLAVGSRQPCVVERPAQQIGEAQVARPCLQVGTVQRGALNFEDAEHIVPLAVGHAAARAAAKAKFTNGGRGSLHVSQVTAGRKNCLRYEISGAKCALAWNSEAPNELWIGHRSKPNESLVRDPSLLSDMPRQFSNYPGGHNEGFPDTFKQLYAKVYDYILAGDYNSRPDFPTFADGHYEMQLCEAIQRSATEKAWVKVD